ncbi:MAG: hypothetical protein HY736_14865 [Verrucomicrobia bacterium]|nr:hypothetical protein [Verrucomicrobiota bacterium]
MSTRPPRPAGVLAPKPTLPAVAGCAGAIAASFAAFIAAGNRGDVAKPRQNRSKEVGRNFIVATMLPKNNRGGKKKPRVTKSCAYNQPAHTGFYLGADMPPAPRPNISVVSKK